MKKLFGFMLLTALFLGLTAQAAQAQNRRRTVLSRDGNDRRGRYTAPTNDEVFGSLKAYTGPESTNGMVKKSSDQLGIVGKYMWNEYPDYPRVKKVVSGATFWVDGVSNELYFLDGCIWDGKPRPNRVKLVETPPPCVVDEPPTLIKFEDRDGKRFYSWEDECENAWTTEVPLPPTPRTPDPVTVTTTVTIPCPECPEIFYKAGATGREKATGGLVSGLLQTGVATAISVLTSSKGNRVRAGAISAGATFGSNRVANAKNPSHDKVDMKFSWPDGHTQTIELKSNKTLKLDRDGVAKWENGLVTVKFGDQECISFEPRTTVNWTVVPVVIRDGKSQEGLEPVKHQDDDNPVVAPDERHAGSRRNNGGQQRAIAPTDGGGQVRSNSSGSRWNRAMKPNN